VIVPKYKNCFPKTIWAQKRTVIFKVEDTDMELPKIYEPIESFKALEERLKYFLDQVKFYKIYSWFQA